MKVICVGIMFPDGLTIGKEYEVEEIEGEDYWIEDDNGNYNPYPSELFATIK